MKKISKLMLILSVLTLFLIHDIGFVQADDPDPIDEGAQNPVVVYLAGLTGLGTQEILNLQNTGYGLGQIAKAFYLIDLSGVGELEAVMAEAKEIGWGNLYKNWGNHPSEIKGLGWLFKHEGKPDQVGPPDHANNDKDKDTSPPEHANNDKDKDKDTSPPEHANDDKDKDDKDKDKD